MLSPRDSGPDWFRRETVCIFWRTAGFTGTFRETEARNLEQCFPQLLKQMEWKLLTGELNPCQQDCITLNCNELTCEADTLGSCGYVYIAIYPTPKAT